MENVELKEMTPADLEFVKEVYDYYILHSTAVFYLHPLTISELGENIRLGDPIPGLYHSCQQPAVRLLLHFQIQTQGSIRRDRRDNRLPHTFSRR